MKRIGAALLGLLLMTQSFAEQSKTVGDYTVHYNVFNSASLTADIARMYGITRGGNQGVVNIAIRKQEGAGDKASKAKVVGSVQNLVGQKDQLSFKEINEADAIYYIATFRFDDKDHMKFNIDVTPVGGSLVNIALTQQLYVEK